MAAMEEDNDAEVAGGDEDGDLPDDFSFLSDSDLGFNDPLLLDEQEDADDLSDDMLETQEAIAWFNANLPMPTLPGRDWKSLQASPSHVWRHACVAM
jgi:hypothetical protein